MFVHSHFTTPLAQAAAMQLALSEFLAGFGPIDYSPIVRAAVAAEQGVITLHLRAEVPTQDDAQQLAAALAPYAVGPNAVLVSDTPDVEDIFSEVPPKVIPIPNLYQSCVQ